MTTHTIETGWGGGIAGGLMGTEEERQEQVEAAAQSPGGSGGDLTDDGSPNPTPQLFDLPSLQDFEEMVNSAPESMWLLLTLMIIVFLVITET